MIKKGLLLRSNRYARGKGDSSRFAGCRPPGSRVETKTDINHRGRQPSELERPAPEAGGPGGRAVAAARRHRGPLARSVRLRQRPAPGRHQPAPAAAQVRRLSFYLGIRDLPGQPRRPREIHPAQRLAGRHPAGSPRLRLRPLPRRRYGLARPATPDELTAHPLVGPAPPATASDAALPGAARSGRYARTPPLRSRCGRQPGRPGT